MIISGNSSNLLNYVSRFATDVTGIIRVALFYQLIYIINHVEEHYQKSSTLFN